MKNRETAALLKRQAEWQASRKSQSWGDKLRQCIKARDSLRGFRKNRPTGTPARPGPDTKPLIHTDEH